MDKLINQLYLIASFYRYRDDFDSSFTDEEIAKLRAQDEVAAEISSALRHYRQRAAESSSNESSSNEISSKQLY